MQINGESLAAKLGVNPIAVQEALALDYDAVAENTAMIAVETIRAEGGGTGMLSSTEAINTLLGLQNTDWRMQIGEDRAVAAVYHLRALGNLGITVPGLSSEAEG